jgi:hypothetical protein
MAVHPPIGHWLIGEVGWRNAWIVLGFLTWLLLIPPIVFLVWNKPKDRGLAPDGASVAQDSMAGRRSAASSIRTSSC